MKKRILVLNCDSFAAVTSDDVCRAAGFKAHEDTFFTEDLTKGARYNRFMSLSAMLSEHVMFNAADKLNVHYATVDKSYDGDESKLETTSEPLAHVMSDFEFYSKGEFSTFNVDFVNKNFDGIFYFLHHEIDEDFALNEEFCALMNSESCPPVFIFNVKVQVALLEKLLTYKTLITRFKESDDLSIIQRPIDVSLDEEFKEQPLAYALMKVMAKAQALFVMDSSEDISFMSKGIVGHTLSATWAGREKYVEFYERCQDQGLIERVPKIHESLNGYLNFRNMEVVRSLILNTGLVKHLQHEPDGIGYEFYADHIKRWRLMSDGSVGENTLRTIPEDIVNMIPRVVQSNSYTRKKTCLISSSYLVKHPVFGVSPDFFDIFVKLYMARFQGYEVGVLFNDNIISHFEDFSKQIISEYAAHSLAASPNPERYPAASSNDKHSLQLLELFEAGSGRHKSTCLSVNATLAFLIIVSNHLLARALDAALPGSFQGLNHNAVALKVREAIPPIRKMLSCISCYIYRDYDEFVSLKSDVFISDRFYEQELAVSAGKAVLGVIPNESTETDISDFYFHFYVTAKPLAVKLVVDLLDDDKLLVEIKDLIKKLVSADVVNPRFEGYNNLKSQGLMRRSFPMPAYRKVKEGTFGLWHVVPQISMHQLYGLAEVETAMSTVAKSFGSEINTLSKHLVEITKSRHTFLQQLAETFDLEDSKSNDVADSCSASSANEQLSVKTAQISNFTEANRYYIQWLYLSFYARVIEFARSKRLDFSNHNILSFGCSRGREVCDLVRFFPEAHITGVDINPNAIAYAKQLLANIAVKPQPQAAAVSGVAAEERNAGSSLNAGSALNAGAGAVSGDGMKLVEVQGNRAWVGFDTLQDLLAKREGNEQARKYDIITVMTVLCRHPDTLKFLNCEEVYSKEEFCKSIELIDSLLAPGGMLCLFNANYSFEITEQRKNYYALYPFTKELVANNGDDLFEHSSSEGFVLPEDGLWDGCNNVAVYNSINLMKFLQDSVPNLLPGHVTLPEVLREIERNYKKYHVDMFGYTALFDQNSYRVPNRTLNCTIYLKKDS